MTTVDTGTGITVTPALPTTPSAVAVIVAGPGLTPLTIPAASTVATLGADDDQVTGRPVSAFPFPSFGLAKNWI
ncbi:MAG: hypothetical protein J0626_04100, partial [Rhodospirillaceae bacterium]|nr:hypothetical protein [Rhodospirillaceae bacterium]